MFNSHILFIEGVCNNSENLTAKKNLTSKNSFCNTLYGEYMHTRKSNLNTIT